MERLTDSRPSNNIENVSQQQHDLSSSLWTPESIHAVSNNFKPELTADPYIPDMTIVSGEAEIQTLSGRSRDADSLTSNERAEVGLDATKDMPVSLNEIPRGELTTIELTVDGMERAYQVYIPESYSGEGPIPVVYALHGLSAGDPQGLLAGESDFNRFAEERGFAVIYPLAALGDDGEYSWNSPGAGLTDNDPSYDDINYLRSVIESAQRDLGIDIDEERQIIVGFSEGAQMAQHAARAPELQGEFSGIGAVHGTLTGAENYPEEGVPTVIIHGAADEMLPWDGGMGTASWLYQQWNGTIDRVRDSQPQLQLDWALQGNQCEGEPQLSISLDGRSTLAGVGPELPHVSLHSEYTAEQCNGAPVDFYWLAPGQHAWHGGAEGGLPLLGEQGPFPTSQTLLDELLPTED